MRRLSVALVVLSLILSSFVFMPSRVSAEDTPQFVVQKWASFDGGQAFAMGPVKGTSGVAAYIYKDGIVYQVTPEAHHDLINAIHEKSGLVKLAVTWGTTNYIGVLFASSHGSSDSIMYVYNMSGDSISKTSVKGFYDVGSYGIYFFLPSFDGLYRKTPTSAEERIEKNDTYRKVVRVDRGVVALGYSRYAYYRYKRIYSSYQIANGVSMYAAWIDDEDRYMYVLLENVLEKVELSSGEAKIFSKIPFKVSMDATYLMKTEKGYIVTGPEGVYFSEDGKEWNQIHKGKILSADYYSGTLYILTPDGVYTVSEYKPLNVSMKTVNFVGDINTVAEQKPYIEIVNKEDQDVIVSCKTNASWLKPEKDTITVKAADGAEAEKTEFEVILTSPGGSGLIDNYPDTPTVGATVSCTVKTKDGAKSKTFTFTYTIKLPQITIKQTNNVIWGDPHVWEKTSTDERWNFAIVSNNGATYGEVECSLDGGWGEIIFDTDENKVYPGKEIKLKLKPYADKTVKENHGNIVCKWIGGSEKMPITFIRTDIVNVKAIFDVGSGEVEYKDFANWKGVLAIENSDTTTVSVSCSPNVDWLLPDIWTATVVSGSTSKVSIMPKPSVIEAHWPTAPSVYGAYTCNIEWDGGSMVQHTATLRVKLPQLQFKNLAYDITVAKDSGDVPVVKIENTGDGLGEVTCQTDKDWAHIKMSVDGGSLHDTAMAVIRKMAGIALRFDYDSMPDNDLVNITCRWAGGEYKADFNVVKQTGPEYSLNIITTHVPLADVIDDFATIASIHVSGGSIPLHVSADKGFIIVKADSEVSDGSADISIGIDRKKITFADMIPPYIKVNITVQYGDKQDVIPVKIEIKRALKLFVPLNKLEQTYELWTPEKEWQKLVSSDSAPFINPLYNRTYVPLRLVSEGLGLEVGWNGKERLITIESDKYKIVLDVKKVVKKKVKIAGRHEYIYESTNRYAKIYEKSAGSTSYGRSVYVYPTAIRQGRSYVPVRFIAEQVKSLVFWDGKTRTVYIYR